LIAYNQAENVSGILSEVLYLHAARRRREFRRRVRNFNECSCAEPPHL